MSPNYLKLSVLLLIISFSANAQIITTYAGTGIAGYSGDGGQATAARLYSPYGLALDNLGNLYIAERINNIIRKVTPAGIVSTYAGDHIAGYSGDGGPATNAKLNTPYAIVLDRNDNLYFTDNGNNVIRRIDHLTGIITTVPLYINVLLHPHPAAGLVTGIANPTGIAMDDSGYIYFSNTDWRVVLRFNAGDTAKIVAGDGHLSYSGDGGPATVAELNNPLGLACDHAGNVYIADEGNNVVRKINSAHIISKFAGNGAAGGFYGDGGPATVAGLFGPVGVTTDDYGNVYVQDIFNRRIRKVNLAGQISTVAGNGIAAYTGDGGPATAASFYNCTGFAVDGLGNYYISDLNFSVIRKVTPDVSLDIKEIASSNNRISLYPNPNNGSFKISGTVNTPNNEGLNVIVTNIVGQVVHSSELTVRNGNINTTINLYSGLPAGVYMVHLGGQGISEVFKFVVEK